MPDFLEQLQATLSGTYRIENELGGGGMSRVFVATETALDRRIVIKIMSPELAAGLSTERFQREVMLAAKLQQANIVPLLTTGSSNGLPWYTMPFVKGKSLRERLQTAEPLPINEAISILRDVARALAYAHSEGVVHRDIKPENVLISGGTAVVTDFGIAKAMDLARAQDNVSITLTGSTIGTPAYMAPEQIAGSAVDQRTDLYAWGVMAFEVLTGSHPFAGKLTAQGLMAAHLTEAPPSLKAARADLDPALADLVQRCLSKEAASRPKDAADILRAFDTTASGPTSVPSRPRANRLLPLGVAAAAVLAIAIAFRELSDKSAATGARATQDSVRSIAVLPFLNLGGDSTQEYLADGMTDELATALGRMRGLRVTARSSAYRYKNRRDFDVRTVGQELGAHYLLTGTVRRVGQQLRVSAQLTSAMDRTELWARSFDQPVGDLLRVQDSVTDAIAMALEQRFNAGTAPANPPQLARAQGTQNAAAYDLYLQGNYLLSKRRPGLQGAASAFERAIALDSGFARAYAGLANVLALYFYYGNASQRPRVDTVETVAARALALDSAMAEAHVALGITLTSQSRWSDADLELRRAVALEPGYANAHLQLGRNLVYIRKLDEAIQEFELARQLDPYGATLSAWLAFSLAAKGDTARALAESQRSLQLDSLSGLVTLFWPMTQILLGRGAEAREFAKRMPRNAFTEGAVAYYEAATGDTTDARALVTTIRARGSSGWHDERNLAFALLAIGDTAAAFKAMERSKARGEPIASFLPLWAPLFDPVRSSPHFLSFSKSVGLDEAAIRP